MTDGQLPEADLVDLTLFMLQWNYEYTRLDPVAVVEAGRRTYWEPSREPLASVVRLIGHPGTQAGSLFILCASVIQAIFRNAVMAHQQDNTVRAIIHALLRRPDGRVIAVEIARRTGEIFGIDFVRGQRCRQLILNVLRGLVG
jgi:hypothetical protein